jgi:hypothetical protein
MKIIISIRKQILATSLKRVKKSGVQVKERERERNKSISL